MYRSSAKLKKIPNPYIIETIEEPTEDARPPGCTKLKGASDLWRVRVNNYRIVYQIKDEQLLILVIRIGHRKDIYEGL